MARTNWGKTAIGFGKALEMGACMADLINQKVCSNEFAASCKLRLKILVNEL